MSRVLVNQARGIRLSRDRDVRRDGPPGPRGDRWAGCLPDYEADRLGFLLKARDAFGGIVRFDVTTTIINDPTLASAALMRAEFAVLGNFLNRRVTAAEARENTEARRHLNIGLRHRALGELGASARHAARQSFDAAVGAGTLVAAMEIDPLPILESVISEVLASFYFGPDGPVVATATSRLIEALGRVFGNPFALPACAPTPANLRIRTRYSELQRLLRPLVAARATEEPHSFGGDYAAVVSSSAAAAGLTIDRIVDLLVGSLLAAQRVPAAAAAWTLYELGRSPDWAARACANIDDRRATILEATRLYPPTWLIRRTSTMPVELGGYDFPAGHNFLISPWVLHRDPSLFEDPLAFRPCRWLNGSADPRHLLTFGRGLHRCPGRDASFVVLDAVVGAVLDEHDIDTASGIVTPDPRTTLVANGLVVRFRPRVHGPSPSAAGGGNLRACSTRQSGGDCDRANAILATATGSAQAALRPSRECAQR